MAEPNYEPLIYWIKERESIRIRKALGGPQPWTDDPILDTYRFCNVRREDDLGTIWIRENIREPFADHPNLWFMLCIARQINWPDTLAELIEGGNWPNWDGFRLEHMIEAIEERKAWGDKVFTGAYMISAPAIKGASKIEYIVGHVLGSLWPYGLKFYPQSSLQSIHRQITYNIGWGPFMAYQAVIDMRFTKLLSSAPDIATWAAAGPGTLRGLNRIHGRPIKQPLSQAKALEEMLEIYHNVIAGINIAMDFSDIPNALCETDKYLRVKLNEGRPRALYVAGRGA